jgi:hypothetical protein
LAWSRTLTHLVDLLSLLNLDLQQLLYAILDDFAALLNAPGEGSQRLLQLRLHLGGDVLMRASYRLNLPANDIEGAPQAPGLVRAQRLFA